MEYIFYFMWYFLITLTILFLVSGIDGVFFDLFFLCRSLVRKFKQHRYTPLTYEQLAKHPEQKIAIIVPCWHEANVIKEMLNYNVRAIDYKNYDIFVGVYPNDPETVAAVQQVAEKIPHVICVIGQHPGPTTKADNLNEIYRYIQQREQNTGETYQILVLHDSEDMIHGLSLKLYNYLIPRKDMIQIPVFPLEVNYLNFTHWVYNDEFAENHTKDIIVREAINGLVPSAGVGTALSRNAIQMLTKLNFDSVPFLTGHLTEDYNTSLRIRTAGLKSIFVKRAVLRTQYKKVFFGRYVKKSKDKEYVATRALFPTEYKKAVRQKARWIIGIAMQEMMETGWQGDLPTLYTLFHDRKSLFSHLVNGLAYFVFLFWVFYSIWQHYNPSYLSLQEMFQQSPIVWYMIIACTIMMIERLAQRAYATGSIYGFIPALLSIPRTLYANFLNMHALLRAYYQFFFNPKNKGKPAWEKTDHAFANMPVLQPVMQKLGDFLIEHQYIDQQECIDLLSEQMRTGERFGDLLLKKGILTEKQLLEALAEQYKLPLLTEAPKVLPASLLKKTSKYHYNKLLKNHILPIKLSDNDVITLAITDPTNHIVINQALHYLQKYQIEFVLVLPSLLSGK